MAVPWGVDGRDSRRMLGWTLSTRRDAALTSDALRHSALPSHSSGSRTYPYVSTELAPDPGWHEISTRKHKRGPPVSLVRYAPPIVKWMPHLI